MFGLKAVDNEGSALCKYPTRFLQTEVSAYERIKPSLPVMLKLALIHDTDAWDEVVVVSSVLKKSA